jgi:hypothetical protein
MSLGHRRAISAGAFAETQSNSTETELNNRVMRGRAFEAIIWGMPAVNYDLMRQEMFRIGGKENQIVYWSRPLERQQPTLTPNPDSST